MLRLLVLLGPAAALLAQTAAAPAVLSTENLNAVLWMQTSAEYNGAARQAYRAAGASLDRALKERTWTAALEQRLPVADLPPALVLDLDETVIDNTAAQAELVATGRAYNEQAWNGWVAEKRAGLVPGAREFLLMAHASGVAAFYVTNRVCEPNQVEDPTVALLRAHHLPFSPERLLCRTDSGDKSQRRKLVAAGHRILLLIGDDFNDFVSLKGEQTSAEGRLAAAAAFAAYWGDRWFILPNPSYGSWERAVGDTIDAKKKALRR